MKIASQLLTGFRPATPIMFGYFPIGMAFGVYTVGAELDWYWPAIIGLVQYSGAGQFLLVALMAQGASNPVILGTLIILNMRHALYGLPFLDELPKHWLSRTLAIFWLTDEVYSVLTSRPKTDRPALHLVGFWCYAAWNLGCLLGGLVGQSIALPQASLGFSLTALFTILVIEQLRAHKTMIPIGVAVLAVGVVVVLAPTATTGVQLLIMLPMAMLALIALHYTRATILRAPRHD